MRKFGFLFPGQGSQTIGMGKDLYDHFPWVKEVYDQAESLLGFPLKEISFSGPEEKIRQTIYTQPVLFVHSSVLSRALLEKGVEAVCAAGHSLGEFSALASAGAFSFEEGLKLVSQRAGLMQKAGEKGPGTMAAVIGLKADIVMEICMEAREQGIVQPANYNSPQQVVISGSREGVEKAMALCEARGAKRVVELNVSGAFHSQLMAHVMEEFGTVLEKVSLSMPRIPVYANVTAKPYTGSGEIRTLLHHQLTHPVRWVETIGNMIEQGVETFIEVGAGKVLSGLVRRINRDVDVLACGTLDDLNRL
jgi:[acyl-carrier-protein] S-malonyltransferase